MTFFSFPSAGDGFLFLAYFCGCVSFVLYLLLVGLSSSASDVLVASAGFFLPLMLSQRVAS